MYFPFSIESALLIPSLKCPSTILVIHSSSPKKYKEHGDGKRPHTSTNYSSGQKVSDVDFSVVTNFQSLIS